MHRSAGCYIILLVLLLSVPGCGSPGPEGGSGTSSIRVIHTMEGPPVCLHIEGERLAMLPWREESFRPLWIHPYFDHPAGATALEIRSAGEREEQVAALPISLEDDHRYTLILYEADGSPDAIWIDETATLEGHNPAEEALYILVNLIDGSDPIRVVIAGESTLEDVGFGTFKLGVDPPGPVGGVQLFAGDELLAEYPEVEQYIPGAYFLQLYDSFAGQPVAIPVPTYVGELILEQGEQAMPGRTILGEIPHSGSRIQHILTLAERTTLSFTLERLHAVEEFWDTDLELHIYAGDGQLLLQSVDDMVEQSSIRLSGVDLQAGNYILEVSKRFDVGGGAYSLTIEQE